MNYIYGQKSFAKDAMLSQRLFDLLANKFSCETAILPGITAPHT